MGPSFPVWAFLESSDWRRHVFLGVAQIFDASIDESYCFVEIDSLPSEEGNMTG
jgi:hypothetical protein